MNRFRIQFYTSLIVIGDNPEPRIVNTDQPIETIALGFATKIYGKNSIITIIDIDDYNNKSQNFVTVTVDTALGRVIVLEVINENREAEALREKQLILTPVHK